MSNQPPTFNAITKLLQQKGYGLTDEQGNIINIDNWARENGGNPYWQNGFQAHYEDYYGPKDKAAFSPLPNNPLSIEGALIGAIIAIFMRTPQGQKSLEKIIEKYLDSCARIVESVQEACHSNWLTALNNQHITAAIGHKMGLIDDSGYLKIVDHYRSVFDKMLQESYISILGNTFQGITTLVTGSKYNVASQASAPVSAAPEKSSTETGGLAAILKAIKG